MRNAGYFAIFAGVLLLLSGASGWGIFAFVWDVIKDHLAGDWVFLVSLVFRILIFLAALGGLTVIIGGYFMLKGYPKTGKVFVMIGCGTGILTLLVLGLIAYLTNTWDSWTSSMLGFTGIGIVLAWISRKLA
jgi:hypothetical protein